MEPKLHQRVQRYGWDLAVADYDRCWLPVLAGCAQRVVDLARPAPGDRVLDVASGTGIAAFLAAERVGSKGEVVATDLSAKMTDAVRAEIERRGAMNITAERMDGEELSFPDGSFDAVLCVLGLMYPAEPQRAIEQAFRVLRPGGRFAACVWGRRDRCGWNAVFPITDARVNSDVCPLFFSLGGEGAVRYALETAGFADIEEERVERTLAWESDEEACTAIFAGGPVALAYSRFEPAVKAEVHAEYLSSIKDYKQPDGGYRVPGEFVFASAVRPLR